MLKAMASKRHLVSVYQLVARSTTEGFELAHLQDSSAKIEADNAIATNNTVLDKVIQSFESEIRMPREIMNTHVLIELVTGLGLDPEISTHIYSRG